MNIFEILTKEEIDDVTKKSDWRALHKIATDWAIITGTFFLMATYTNPFTLIFGIFILGGRMMGLGVIVHETGHRTFFKSKWLNDFVGNWLSGYWVFSYKEAYMQEHLKHHRNAGTDQDPDIQNYKHYPIDQASFKRKIIRDVTGQVGFRRIKSIARMTRNMAKLEPKVRQYLLRSYGVNLGMLAVLTFFNVPWLYLTWVIAFITSHMLVVRIRQISEHAAVPDLLDKDPRKNTRTLYLSWLERFFIAPHGVNYHLEHHILASVPIYRLEQMHNLLLKKGFYNEVKFHKGYLNLLRQVVHN